MMATRSDPNLLRRLTSVGLGLTVAALSVLVLTNYWLTGVQARRVLENRLDQQLRQMASSLANPLWSYDQQTVRLMGDAFMAGTDAAGLEVVLLEVDGPETVYSRAKPLEAAAIAGRWPISHRDQIIGEVRIALSRADAKATLRRLLVSSTAVALAIFASVFLFMKYLFRRQLVGPLQALGRWTEQVALGEYGEAPDEITAEELKPIVAKFSEMSSRIREREQSLRESEQKFRHLADLLPGILFEADLTGRVTFMSREGLNILQYGPRDLEEGVTLDRVVAPEDQAKLARNLAKLADRDPREGNEYTAIKKDGTRFPLLVFAVQAVEDGQVVGLRGIALDVTRQKNLERHLAQTSKLESIGTLAGGIAHDFNNILSAILGYTELSLDGGQLGEDDRDNLESVHTAAERARELVKQILMFSRREPEQQGPTRIDLVVEEALSLVRKAMPANIRITQHIDQATGQVPADATRLHQIVMNLCTNAYHAMTGSGGDLGVNLDRVDVGAREAARLPGLRPGPCALLTVSDTGTGIEPDLLERIFDPFFTTKEPGKGTGMGLSVVHGIVRNQGGAVEVLSEVGVGTTFRVYLPRLDDAPPAVVAAEDSVPHGDGERILFVDDDPQLAVMGRRILTALGYRVVATQAVLHALDRFRESPEEFDLVITDQSMPELSGSRFAAELRLVRPDLPVLICTGFSEDLDVEGALAEGVRTVLIKPVNMSDLARAVRQALDTPAVGRGLPTVVEG